MRTGILPILRMVRQRSHELGHIDMGASTDLWNAKFFLEMAEKYLEQARAALQRADVKERKGG